MAPRKPQVGATYRFKKALGQGDGRIVAGQVVTVREVVPATEPGANAFAKSFDEAAASERSALREAQRQEFPYATAVGVITTPTAEWTDDDYALSAEHAEAIRQHDEAHQSDAVVVEWTEPDVVESDDGQRVVGERPRAFSLATWQVAELLEEV